MPSTENLKPWKPGESGNPNGRPKADRDGSPQAVFVDEPDAPQLLRDMRWVYATGVLPKKATAGQKAVRALLDADAPRFLATLERLESEWAEEKRRRQASGISAPPDADPDAPVQLDEVSARAVESIDRWLAAHRKRAESLHTPSSSDPKASTGLARDH